LLTYAVTFHVLILAYLFFYFIFAGPTFVCIIERS